MKTIILGNSTLEIKDYYCASDHIYIPKEDGKLWLYVNITDVCPARCPFCVNPGRKSGNTPFDISRFRETLIKIKSAVYGVSFTGGEPMMEPAVLDEAIGIVREQMGSDLEIDMVTSGIRLNRLLEFSHLNYLDSIHVSRHRTDDNANRMLMGVDVPTADEIRNILDQMEESERVVFNCVLSQEGICNVEKMAEYLEMAALIGVHNTSFIRMVPVNAYSKKQQVDPEQFNIDKDWRFKTWNHFCDHEYCSCSSGDYQSKHGRVRFYYRVPGKKAPDYVRQLVYTADNKLLDGFGGREVKV